MTKKERDLKRAREILRANRYDRRIPASGRVNSKHTPIELAVIPMPICKAEPFTALNGQQVTKQAIDTLLKYNPKYRMAYLYLNPKNAHNHDGETNRAVLGRFPKEHYVKDGVIYGDVELQRLFRDDVKQKEFEKDILLLASENGGYPSRSLDLVPYRKNGKIEYIFDGVALCGAAKGAVPDLPTINLDELLKLNGIQSFSLDTNISKENNEMDAKEIQELINKSLKTAREEWEQESTEKIQLALDKQEKHLTTKFETESKKIKDQVTINERRIAEKEADIFFRQPEIKTRVLSTQRENGKAILLALEELTEAKIELSMYDKDSKETKVSTGLAAAFKNFVESLPAISLSRETDEEHEENIEDSPDVNDKSDDILRKDGTIKLSSTTISDKRFELVQKVAAKEKLDIAKPDELEKAQNKAIELAMSSKNHKDLFGKLEEAN